MGGDFSKETLLGNKVINDGKWRDYLQAILTLLNSFAIRESKQDFLDCAVNLIRHESGCQFVGIRVLNDGGYIPYQSYTGFSCEFWELENMIQITKQDCKCTRLAGGCLLPVDMPIINSAGSLCCNDIQLFAESLTDDQKKMYRGACNSAGYRSLAIIPIRHGSNVLGLVHLADLQPNKLTPVTMEFVESITALIGEVLTRDKMEQSLKISQENRAIMESANAELENQVATRTRELQEINATLEEEIVERQQSQEELRVSRDALMVSKAKLKQYAAELEKTNRELQNFANIVAHDFRAPLVNLKGFSRELDYSLNELRQIFHNVVKHLPEQDKMKVEEVIAKDVPDALQFIHSSVDRLDRMIAALLKLAREGRREMIYKQVDCGELINGILQSFDHQIAQKGIQVEVGPMPIIETDYLAMEQIIGNLLDNAIKYLDPGRPGKISIFCTDNDNEYLFSVQDNGQGISIEDQEKVFEIFRRVGKPDVPGEGMGLAYVQALIRHMGGKVWCESEPGVGTKMNFVIPKRHQE